MSDKKIWFITGAGRGMGAEFAKAALAAGHTVVATGRNRDAVSRALGQSNDVLAVTLDVTSRADAEAAVCTVVDRVGRIDVLVNNAAGFYAGFFEELTPEQIERQPIWRRRSRRTGTCRRRSHSIRSPPRRVWGPRGLIRSDKGDMFEPEGE